MKYYIQCEDKQYKTAMKSYYEKYFRHKVDIGFDNTKAHHFILKDCGDEWLIEELDLHLTKYQSMEEFFSYLEDFQVEDGYKNFEVYTFSSPFNNTGTTVVSLNLAKLFSQYTKTLWFTTENYSSTDYFQIYNQQMSITDMFFYLDHNPDYILNYIEKNSEKLILLNGTAFPTDLNSISDLSFEKLIELLRKTEIKRIVIDFSIKMTIPDIYKKHFFVIEANKKYYARLEKMKELTHHQVLVNKRKLNEYIDETKLRSINFTYMNYDPKLEGEQVWQSESLQMNLKENLKVK